MPVQPGVISPGIPDKPEDRMPSHSSTSARSTRANVPRNWAGRRRLSARRLNRLSRASVAPKIRPFEQDFRSTVRVRSAIVLVVLSTAVGLILCAVLALGATAGVVAVNRSFTATTTTSAP